MRKGARERFDVALKAASAMDHSVHQVAAGHDHRLLAKDRESVARTGDWQRSLPFCQRNPYLPPDRRRSAGKPAVIDCPWVNRKATLRAHSFLHPRLRVETRRDLAKKAQPGIKKRRLSLEPKIGSTIKHKVAVLRPGFHDPASEITDAAVANFRKRTFQGEIPGGLRVTTQLSSSPSFGICGRQVDRF
jgi:hypothetical protein